MENCSTLRTGSISLRVIQHGAEPESTTRRVHHSQHLLKQGRTSVWEAPEQEDEDGKEKKAEEVEEAVKLLGALADDEGVKKNGARASLAAKAYES